MIINTEKTIDFDIIGNYIVSESLASFLLLRSEESFSPDERELLSHVLSLAERNCNIYYMTPIAESCIGDDCIISILFINMHDTYTPNTPDKFMIGMSDYYKTGARYVNHINKFSLSNVHIKISYGLTYLVMRIAGTLKSIECNNTNILLKKLRRIQENSVYGIPEEAKNIATMYDEYSNTILPELLSYIESYNTLKNPAKFFKVKDAKVSKDRTIIFWEDGTKTIIKKAEVEKEFDLEKAIMAAFTRRALSFGHTAKERSVDETIDNIAGMVNDHLDYEIVKREKLLQKVIIPKQEDYDDE